MKTLEERARETAKIFLQSIFDTYGCDLAEEFGRYTDEVYEDNLKKLIDCLKIDILSALQEATAPLISQITDLEVKNQAFRDVLDGDAQMIAGLNRRIGELEEKLADWENAQKMALDEKCSGDQDHCGCVVPLKMRIAELEKALRNLRLFAQCALGVYSWDNPIESFYEPDGGTLQDYAESLGLIKEVPADENFKREWDADTMYVLTWDFLAAQAIKEGDDGKN